MTRTEIDKALKEMNALATEARAANIVTARAIRRGEKRLDEIAKQMADFQDAHQKAQLALSAKINWTLAGALVSLVLMVLTLAVKH